MPAKKKYKDCLSKIDFVPIYFEDWYLDACTPPGKWSFVSAELEDGSFGMWPYLLKKKSIFNYIAMPHLCKWMGPLTTVDDQPEKKQKLLKLLKDQLPEHQHFVQNIYYNSTEINFDSFESKQAYSYQIPLSDDLDQIYSRLDSDYRNNKIKKAAHLTLVVEAPVDDIVEMQMASYHYGKFDIPFDEKYVRNHVKKILKQKKGTILSLRDDENQLYASMFVIWDNQRAYYHLAGMNPELRKSGASIRLIWECIKYAKEELAVSHFDFEGSMIPNLERVRRNFGAKKIHYQNLSRTPSKLFGLMSMIKN